MNNKADYNPGDLKHATVVIRKSERGPSPKEGKERANTTHSVSSKKADSGAANVGGLYDSGRNNALSINNQEDEDGLPQTEDVAILAKQPSKNSNRDRYQASTNPNDDASMIEPNMNTTVVSEKPALFGTFQKSNKKATFNDTIMTNDDGD